MSDAAACVGGAAGRRLSALAGPALLVGAVLAAGLWAYADVIDALMSDWRHDPNYSCGQLVPLILIYLLWRRRDVLAAEKARPSVWGAVLLLFAQVVRGAGLALLFESAQRYAMILTAAGCVLLIGGRRWLWHLRWLGALSLLMVPLPGRVHNAVSGPLQSQATAGAVFLLEVAGVSVVREGHTILMNNRVPLAVAEACSGLRMLTAFVLVAATLAMLIDRPGWQKAVVVLSSVPVAILSNLVRLFVTAELYLHVDSAVAERFFHDFAGLTMMPLAIAMLLGELALLNTLVTADAGPAKSAAVVDADPA
ncbi:MAG: exosortase/archaeosortase family protein [Planctomycetes bacterium]|nr:exosortase/archaeosortase family protein [Planctomycetota bacterium]